MPISSSTILRIIYNAEENGQASTPRVLGIDDWAFRKGKTYGTILVDLEKQKPIDLLPDREASTIEDWLKDHPGVEIISRDRASAYSSRAKAGAPDAIQVADRWHLLKNLGETLKRMLDTHSRELRLAAKDIAQKKQDQETKNLEKSQEKEKEKPNKKADNANTNKEPTLSKFPGSKKISLLLGRDFDTLEEEELKYMKAFIQYCPKASEANTLAQQFKEMTDKLKVDLLDPWIEKTKASGIEALVMNHHIRAYMRFFLCFLR